MVVVVAVIFGLWFFNRSQPVVEAQQLASSPPPAQEAEQTRSQVEQRQAEIRAKLQAKARKKVEEEAAEALNEEPEIEPTRRARIPDEVLAQMDTKKGQVTPTATKGHADFAKEGGVALRQRKWSAAISPTRKPLSFNLFQNTSQRLDRLFMKMSSLKRHRKYSRALQQRALLARTNGLE